MFRELLGQYNLTSWKPCCDDHGITLVIHFEGSLSRLTDSRVLNVIGRHCTAEAKPEETSQSDARKNPRNVGHSPECFEEEIEEHISDGELDMSLSASGRKRKRDLSDSASQGLNFLDATYKDTDDSEVTNTDSPRALPPTAKINVVVRKKCRVS